MVLDESDGLKLGFHRDIIEDSQGRILIASNTGLYIWDGYNLHLESSITGKKSPLVDTDLWKVFEDSKKRIWFGTHSSGCSVYDPETKQVYKFNSEIVDSSRFPIKNVTRIAEFHTKIYVNRQ